MRKLVGLGIKVLLIGLAIYFLAGKLRDEGYQGIFSYSWENAALFVSLFILLGLLNLAVDAAIWRRVHFFVAPLSWRRSFKTNFICYALAFITPVNSGELAGRYVMLSDRTDRQKTIFLTFWSHLPRLVVKVLTGGSALLILGFLVQKIPAEMAIGALIILWPVALLLYFSVLKIQRWLYTKGIGKVELARYVLEEHPRFGEKLQLLGLGLLKYLAYNAQFLVLLLMWGPVEMSVELMLSILGFYFITALVPTFAAADFLIKGALAMYIFTPAMANEPLLLNASFVVWVFNIALPALVGTAIILYTNLGHSLKRKFLRGNPYGPLR